MAELEAQHRDVRDADSHPIGYTLPVAEFPDANLVAVGVAAYDPNTGIIYLCEDTGANNAWVAKAGPHTHDDRYFTEDEVTALLAGKSDTGHVHAWDTITGKPASFPPDAHTHDDRYFTETEVNTTLLSYLLADGSRAVTAPIAGKQFYSTPVVQNAPGAAVTINWAAGKAHKVVMDQDCTVAFTNAVAGEIVSITFDGGYTPTFPSGCWFVGGTLPTFSASNGVPDIVLVYFDGTDYFVSTYGLGFAQVV